MIIKLILKISDIIDNIYQSISESIDIYADYFLSLKYYKKLLETIKELEPIRAIDVISTMEKKGYRKKLIRKVLKSMIEDNRVGLDFELKLISNKKN